MLHRILVLILILFSMEHGSLTYIYSRSCVVQKASLWRFIVSAVVMSKMSIQRSNYFEVDMNSRYVNVFISNPQPSEVVHTPRRGLLKCRDVLHTVGPIWGVHSDKICTELLKKTFENVLHYASHKLKAATIAIPPIGSGKCKTSQMKCLIACRFLFANISPFLDSCTCRVFCFLLCLLLVRD